MLLSKAENQSPPGYYALPLHESAVDFLQRTGVLIAQLKFHGDLYGDDERDDISRAIARYCGGSLTELDLQEADNILITGQAERFSKVRSLRIRYEFLPTHVHIHLTYPALENLSVYVGSRLVRSNPTLARIRDILPLVPQLRSLTVDGVANTLLPSIRRNMRHLESLSIKYDADAYADESTHFSSVRNFRVHVMRSADTESRPIPFTFDRLEVLELTGSANDDNIMGWLQQNVHLKELSTDVRLDKMAATSINSLPALDHVTLNVNAAPSLATMLERLHRVRRVTFTITLSYAFQQQRLLATLPDGWKVVDGWHQVVGTDSLTVQMKTWNRLKSRFGKWF